VSVSSIVIACPDFLQLGPIVPFRWRQIKTDNVTDVVDEQWIGRELECLLAMRL
jgi:hypothetical protein